VVNPLELLSKSKQAAIRPILCILRQNLQPCRSSPFLGLSQSVVIFITAIGQQCGQYGRERGGNALVEANNDFYVNTIRHLAEALDSISNPQSCPKGETLFRQGEPATGVLVLRQGKVCLYACSPDGHTRLSYRTVGPGYVLGLPALFSGEPYSLNAEALEECVFGFVDCRRALQLVRERLDLCLEATKLLAHEVRQLPEWQAVVAAQPTTNAAR